MLDLIFKTKHKIKWQRTEQTGKLLPVDIWKVEILGRGEWVAFNYVTGHHLRKKLYSRLYEDWEDAVFDKREGCYYITKPQPPAIDRVVENLIYDAEALDLNYDDWCDVFGYSTDSISALDTYRKCLSIGRSLLKCFSIEQIREMRDYFHNQQEN